MQSNKTRGIVGVALAATASALGMSDQTVLIAHDSEDVGAVPIQKKAKGSSTKSAAKAVPTKAQLKKMSAEKRTYWERKMVNAAYPAYYRAKRNVQAQSGNVKAVAEAPLTRQIIRAQKRKENKQPLNVPASVWCDELNRQRKAARLESQSA
jgi:hypothetical protein